MSQQYFHKHSRENSEPCVIKENNRVNSSIMNYVTTQEKQNKSDVEDTALNHPSVLFSDGHVGPSGVENSTALRFGTVTNHNDFQQLCSRSNSVFMDDVKPLKNTSKESELRSGAVDFDKKKQLHEKQPSVFSPQVSNVRDNIKEMQNSIPNSDIRFGVNTRLNKSPWKM